MSDTSTGDEVGRYRIRLQGHLDSRWNTWFDGMTVVAEIDGSTVVSGPVIDQAALHGLLTRVRDLGLPLISVTPELTNAPFPRSTDPRRSR